MNLFGPVTGIISAVNPCIQAILRASSGSETLPSGRVTPEYTEVLITIQVQAANSEDLQQVANLNQSTDARSVYVYGHIKGLDRAHQFGGDILVFDDSEWLVVGQPEQWGSGEWCKLIVVRQIPSQQTCPKMM